MKSVLYMAMKNGLVYSIIAGLSVVNVPVYSLAAAVEQVDIDPALQQADNDTIETALDDPAAQTQLVDIDNDANSVPKQQLEPITVDDNPGEIETPQEEAVVIDNDTGMVQTALTEPVVIDNDASETVTEQEDPVVIDNDEGMTLEETAPIVVETIPEIDDSEPVDGMTMLYIVGGATLALGAVVLMGSSSGGSDDSGGSVTPSPDPDPIAPPVGPNMNGDWSGFLQLKQRGSEGYQGIVASIVHQGNSIRVSTSSTLDYGRYFNGTISSSGYILMYDSITGEDWTTHKGNASSRQMDMYDYVNNFKDLDRMLLTR